MKSAAASEADTEGQCAFFHLWWTRLTPHSGMDDLPSSVGARRDRRRTWVRSRLASVTDDVEGAIAAIGRPPRSGGAGEWAGWSSCGDVVVLAFGYRPLAVDIEALRPVPPGMGGRFGIDPDQFWQGWTRKEAGLKLLGTGLRIDPARVRLLTDGGAAIDGHSLSIRVKEIGAPPGHVAALAYVEDGGMGDAGGR